MTLAAMVPAGGAPTEFLCEFLCEFLRLFSFALETVPPGMTRDVSREGRSAIGAAAPQTPVSHAKAAPRDIALGCQLKCQRSLRDGLGRTAMPWARTTDSRRTAWEKASQGKMSSAMIGMR